MGFAALGTVYITEPALKALTDGELFKVSSSASVIFELVLLDLKLTAILSLLVEYSKTFDSSNSVFFQEARIADVWKDPASCGPGQGSIGSSYRCY